MWSIGRVDLFSFWRENPAATGRCCGRSPGGSRTGRSKRCPTQEFAIERACRVPDDAVGVARREIVLTTAPVARADGSYLIAGGSSGLGLLTAEWLAERGARELLLVSRRASEETLGAAVAGLRERGCRVELAAVDIADWAAVRAVARGSCVRGVVHAAGILHDGLMAELEWPRFSRVLEPKVQGLWNLHELTREMPLDFFVAYSSVASVLGSAGQTNHAAANAFVDALIAWRRRNGLPGLSINWGPWEELGGRRGSGARRRSGRGRAASGRLGREGVARCWTICGGSRGR